MEKCRRKPDDVRRELRLIELLNSNAALTVGEARRLVNIRVVTVTHADDDDTILDDRPEG